MTQESDSPPPNGDSDITPRAAALLMVAIVAIALALRLYGLDWDDGYDWTPHPDERAILFKVMELSFPPLGELHLLFDAEQSPLNPRWFPYGSFPLYLLDVVETLSKAIPGLGSDDLRVPARAVSGIADVIAVVFAYLLGRAIWSRKVGVLGAYLVAVAVLHIQLSHFFAVDTLLALLTVLAMFFLVRVARFGRLADSALAGLFIGLALATKISIAPILAPYAVAHLIYAGGLVSDDQETIFDRLRRAMEGALIGGAVMIAAFAITQPYALLDWAKFYADISEQSEMVSRVRDYPYTRQYIDTAPYLYHAQQLAAWGLGIPMGVAALIGLLYAAMRGLRIWQSVPYLLLGVVPPAAILILWSGLAATMLASAIAVAAIVATIPLRSRDTRMDALLLSLAIPYLLIVGAFDVKFMRYLIPVTPILLLFASRMFFDFWTWACRVAIPGRAIIRAAAFAVVVLSVGATAFYGLAYVNMYADTHTAVRASEWMSENAPADSLILKEHWEEGLPRLHGHRIEELQIYEPDTPAKLRRMSDRLARADYAVLYSNRLYGTVSRLPERYPVSRAYYQTLFSGDLGYDLDASFTSYPNLLGVGFVDDTFGRPDLEPPAPLVDARPHPVSLNLGYADESFSVYDHPKTLIFRNSGRLDAETISQRILDRSDGYPSDEPRIVEHSPAPEPSRRLMLTPEQSENRRAGGAWNEIVRTGGIAERAPALVWIVVVQAIALASVPLCFVAFRSFADRGWAMSKAVGLLLVGLGAWLLASFEMMPFARATILAAGFAFAALNLALLVPNPYEFADFIKRRWKTIAAIEIIFLVAFLAFVAIRMANPDLWHPYRGGEKPMDMAYLNAVLRSVHMPPYDPWFSGGYLNYYYWGQFLVSTLIHLTGIAPEIAVNLAIPTFFAMTVALSYGVAYNLAAAARVRALSPAVAGIAGAAFVTVIGNLDGAIQLAQSAWRVAIEGLPAASFDFWRSSRMMPPDPPGFEITEFPFFTFLFADPHAHLWALPFTVLCVGLSASALLGLARTARDDQRSSGLWGVWGVGHLLTLALLGIAVGALRALNTWDYPTYLLFAFACVGIGEYLSQGGLSGGAIFRTAAKSAFVLIIGYVAFLPYHSAGEVFFLGVESTTNRTTLWQMLGIFGLFVFVIGSYCLWILRRPLGGVRSAYRQLSGSITDVLSGVAAPRLAPGLRGPASPALVALVVSAAFLVGMILTALFSGSDWGAVTLAGALLGLILIIGVRSLAKSDEGTPAAALVVLAAATALCIVIGIDFVRVEGDIDRLNSVFKFYLQAWALFAIASAYIVWRMASAIVRDRAMPGKLRWAWTGCLIALILCALVFTALGSRARIGDRFDNSAVPLTLDGLAYAESAAYRDEKGEIDLSADLEGIQWLRQNAQGSPVILEGLTPSYRWGGRVSVHTGLPSVIGWDWHQQQQRWGYRNMVSDRISDVNTIYNTTDADEALNLLRRYDVAYIYVGRVERLYYDEAGLAKFEDGLGGRLRPVFETDAVSIYEFDG